MSAKYFVLKEYIKVNNNYPAGVRDGGFIDKSTLAYFYTDPRHVEPADEYAVIIFDCGSEE